MDNQNEDELLKRVLQSLNRKSDGFEQLDIEELKELYDYVQKLYDEGKLKPTFSFGSLNNLEEKKNKTR